jgi:hypothetical protein
VCVQTQTHTHTPANIEQANESLQGPLRQEGFDVAFHWPRSSLHFQRAEIPEVPWCGGGCMLVRVLLFLPHNMAETCSMLSKGQAWNQVRPVGATFKWIFTRKAEKLGNIS